MTSSPDLERALRHHFEATADTTVLDGQVDAIVTASAERRQVPAWSAALRSFTMSTTTRSLGRPMSATAWAMLLIIALLIAAVGIAVSTGNLRIAPAPIVNGPIVFGRYTPAVEDVVLYVVRPDGSGEHELVPGANECPQFSPDGRLVTLGGGIANADGTGIRAFTESMPGITLGCATWAPDGKRLAAEGWSDTDASAGGIYLRNASDGGAITRLTTNGEGNNDTPSDWSPDGRQIAYVHGSGGKDSGTLWVVDVANGSTHQVVPDLVDLGPAWSPDGQWIVVDGVGGQSLQNTFIVVHPDGSDQHLLRPPVAADYVGFPQFSPDGTRLVFHMKTTGAKNADIYTMGLDGTDLVQITNTPDQQEYFTDWGVQPS